MASTIRGISDYIQEKFETIYQNMIASTAFVLFLKLSLVITTMLAMAGGAYLAELVIISHPSLAFAIMLATIFLVGAPLPFTMLVLCRKT